jgi:hypothetical protein
VSLEQKDVDELAARLRDWLVFDGARSAGATREALAKIDQTLQSAAEVIGAGFTGGMDITDDTPLKSAWRLVHARARATGSSGPLQDFDAIIATLTEWSVAARLAAKDVPQKHKSAALPLITDALIVRIRHRDGSISSNRNGSTVGDLLRLYKSAGGHLTRDAAVKAVKEQIRAQRARE